MTTTTTALCGARAETNRGSRHFFAKKGATLKERLAAGMAAMEKFSDKRKRPADHSNQAATPAKKISKPLQYHPRVGGAQGGQPGADVPAQPPVAAQSNLDIALKSALRRLRANMLDIADRQVATPDEVRSMLKEQQEVRGLLSTRTPLRNSVEAFLDLLEASLRAKLEIP